MLEAWVCMGIGVAAVIAALVWFALRRRASAGRHRTTALVTGSVGRPDDDLRALTLRVTDADGQVRVVNDTFYSAFAQGMRGMTVDVEIDPPAEDGTPGRVRVPRQSNPVMLLNALLAASGVAFFMAGLFMCFQASLTP